MAILSANLPYTGPRTAFVSQNALIWTLEHTGSKAIETIGDVLLKITLRAYAYASRAIGKQTVGDQHRIQNGSGLGVLLEA